MEEENTFISLLTERLVELLGPVAPMAVDQLHGIMVDCKEKARSATTGEDIEFLSPVPASSLPKPLDSHAATINIANQNSVNYPRIPPYLSTSTSTEYYRHSSSEAVVGGCTNPLSSYFDNAVACTHPSIPLKPNPSNFQDSGFLSGATICLDQHKSEFDFNEDPLPPAMWPFSHGLFTPQEPRCTCNNRLHPYQCAYDTAHQDPKIECANAQVSQQFNLDSSPFIPTQDQNVAFSANTFLARNGSNLSMSHDGSLPAKRHMPVAALLGLNDPGDWLEERVPGHFLTRFDPGDGILSQQNVQASTSSGISTEVSRVQDFTFGLEEQQDRANYSQPR
jgi:hypothetical protein